MSPLNISWYQGWKIILRCAQFNCRETGPKFASTAILKHMPAKYPSAGISWLRPTTRSIVFPEQAFDTMAEANSDALIQAQRYIAEANEAPTSSTAPA